MRVRYKKEHTIQFTKVQYFCHYAKKNGWFLCNKKRAVKREGKEYKESKEVREVREVREFREFREVREISEIKEVLC